MRNRLIILSAAALLLLIPSCSSSSAVDHMWLGDSNAKQGNWDTAITEYQTAMNLKSDVPDASKKLATSYNNRAVVRIKAQDYSGAQSQVALAPFYY